MNKLKYWRLERGLNQLELADAADVPRWRIQQAEGGYCLPSKDQMGKLAFALGVKLEQLFGKQATKSTVAQ
ncbi:MAG: helix-turn-helix transcriptional regulator [Bdellovibrionota bacterium]